MARTIVQQPDGLYSVFSSVVDDFVYTDMTEQDIVDAYIEDERDSIKQRVSIELERMRKHIRFSYDDALETIKDVHGDDAIIDYIK